MNHQDFPRYVPRPPDPLYPLTDAAEHRHDHDYDRLRPYVAVALAITIVVAAVAVFIVFSDNIAARAGAAGDRAAVPSAQPGPPVPQPADDKTRSAATKPAEKAPPVAAIVEGDGTWLIGREIRRATYESFTGPTCYWARLSNLSGEFDAVIASGFGRTGMQRVTLGATDVAFVSQGCGEWTEVKR
ncbi:hypothetical protein [Kribbella catacumbae]|uniref:hypothetical protein n=1 Tax=Kribbella catacumbae TaxID=460086 RepID=UPI00036898DC|nr:hypothetical protein [Kribbella catacumbae]